MNKRFDHVYRFKVSLKDIKPPIWRRIEVPANYTFWDLHVAIQDAMGWSDSHLHEFEIKNPHTNEMIKIGYPDMEYGENILICWKELIANYFTPVNKTASYIYDFGDYWQHKVQLEQIHPVEKGQSYPKCLNGKRACPPEDCGGVGGYYNLLEILSDPMDEDYETMIEWLGEEYHPDFFDLSEVGFDDPKERFQNLGFN